MLFGSILFASEVDRGLNRGIFIDGEKSSLLNSVAPCSARYCGEVTADLVLERARFLLACPEKVPPLGARDSAHAWMQGRGGSWVWLGAVEPARILVSELCTPYSFSS